MNTNKAHRETRQKEVILSVLQGTHEHPTADWIYDQARKKMPHISKGTVYRNLTVLLEDGSISALNLGGTVTRYEIKQKPHDHFRCEQCGRVIDLTKPVNINLDQEIEKETGLKVSHHFLEFRGICRDCQLKLDKS